MKGGVLNGWRATVMLISWIGMQLVVGVVAGGVAFGLAFSDGGVPGEEAIAGAIERLMPWIILATFVGGGVLLFVLSRLWFSPALRDTAPTGAAWVMGRRSGLGGGFVVGLATGLGFLAVSLFFEEPEEGATLGPMVQMAQTPGLGRVLWLCSVLLLAPPLEELLFRGVVYGGYRRSLGALWAAVLTSVIFVLMHVSELIHYPPGFLGVGGLAVAALWCRLRWGAIGPAISAHFAYNFTIVVAFLVSTES